MSLPVLLSVDYELTGYDSDPEAFKRISRQVIDWFDQKGVRATFFCVGDVLERHPDLVCQIAQKGHEVACHGWKHMPLEQMDACSLENDLRKFLAAQENLGLPRPLGYRAPFFSLTYRTRWALDVIRHMGFVYDSSPIPARTMLYGYPEINQDIHQMANGLIEIPVSVAKGPLKTGIPLLGGTYLRLMPWWPIRLLISRFQGMPVAYCHPYDLDTNVRDIHAFPGNPFYNFLLGLGQKRMKSRLESIIQTRKTITFADAAKDFLGGSR
ncbi:MAG: DUF3473 domain-containing protein [Gammaproteobacteria bacterium]|nr:MAG: DUF3473 domain-containing protein [Gammaproteobacteria bacterium]